MLQRALRAWVTAVAGMALLSVSAAAQTIKIGLISSYSGPFAQAGDELDLLAGETGGAMRRGDEIGRASCRERVLWYV